jgi:hypothetical protein
MRRPARMPAIQPAGSQRYGWVSDGKSRFLPATGSILRRRHGPVSPMSVMEDGERMVGKTGACPRCSLAFRIHFLLKNVPFIAVPSLEQEVSIFA